MLCQTPILITGCQRSGTTLLGLILSRHSDFDVLDEDAWSTGVSSKRRLVCKLPVTLDANLFLKQYPQAKIVWMWRHPAAVVTSMMQLTVGLPTGGHCSWAAHPGGAVREIRQLQRLLPADHRQDLTVDLERANTLFVLKPRGLRWSREDRFHTALLCWRLKDQLRIWLQNMGKLSMTLDYEDLVTQQEEQLRRLCQCVGAQWNPVMLHHHEQLGGRAMGNTQMMRAVDQHSMTRWQGFLNEDEQQRALCHADR